MLEKLNEAVIIERAEPHFDKLERLIVSDLKSTNSKFRMPNYPDDGEISTGIESLKPRFIASSDHLAYLNAPAKRTVRANLINGGRAMLSMHALNSYFKESVATTYFFASVMIFLAGALLQSIGFLLNKIKTKRKSKSIKRPQVKRELNDLVVSCETQLKFLDEALMKFKDEADRYKQIAGTLRILVCSRGDNKPLLLNLLKRFVLQYEVHPDPTLPFPIMRVGDIGKPPDDDWGKLTEEQIWERHRAKAKPIPLRDFIDSGLAVFIAPYEFSYKELILTLANKMGGSHEDVTTDEPMVRLNQFIIGGYSGYNAPLKHVAEIVLGAGEYLITWLAKNQGYVPHYFKF